MVTLEMAETSEEEKKRARAAAAVEHFMLA